MSRIVFDGNYHVYWLASSPANAAAPTVAEIAAGVDLTAFIPKDGFNPAVTNNRVTGGDLSTAFVDEKMGTYASQLTITAYLDSVSGSNTAWTTIGTRGTTGAIVVCPFAAAAATVKAMVWPSVQVGEPIPMQTAENAQQKFTVDVAVGTAPNLHATIAA